MNYNELLINSPAEFQKPIKWQLPGCAEFGKTVLYNGAALSVGKECKTLGAKHIMLLIGNHVVKTDGGKAVCDALAAEGITCDIFSDIPAEPHFEVIEQLQQHLNEKDYDLVIGVGGGSVMDIAKIASHMKQGNIIEKLNNQDFSLPAWPLILLPTTSGTGSEVSPYSVVTVKGKKAFYSSPKLYPTVALVDPLMTISTPPRITVATAYDAMTHALEGAMARSTPYTDALAVEASAQILKWLPKAAQNGENIEARYYLSCASVMGMMGYAIGGGLYAHSISYILTLDKAQPHGVGCGFALPYTLAMNEKCIIELLDKLAGRCIGASGSEKTRRNTILHIQDLFVQQGMPKSLAELGYSKSEMRGLAEKLLAQYARKNNPRQIGIEEAVMLFDAMFEGEIEYF